MNIFNVGDRVKHKQSEDCIFEVVEILESVPVGISRLYKCKAINTGDKRKRYLYNQIDLLPAPVEDSAS